MRHIAQERDEDYFVSMTDMMVGILLIFIIMLMYFVLQFHVQTESLKEANRQLTEAQETRKEILRELKLRVERNTAMRVEIDEENGVLRLPNEVLFERGRYELTARGNQNIAVLAEALEQVLPCYAWWPEDLRFVQCERKLHRIEAVFIEGHTDADKLVSTGPVSDNWDLSALRATAAYRAVVQNKPSLLALRTAAAGSPVFSVSGYGPDRPASLEPSAEAKRRNRRIELRILMQTPRAASIEKVSEDLKGSSP